MIKFDKISIRQVQALSEVLAESSLFQTELIKAKYLKSALEFEDTVEFMTALDLVEVKGGCVTAGPGYEVLLQKLSSSNKKLEMLNSYLIKHLLYGSSSVTQDFIKFLANFHFENGHYEFLPSGYQRLAYSGLRNLLIELGFLQLDMDEVKYLICDNYSIDFSKLMRSKQLSPLEFTNIQAGNQRIGRNAELRVIKYEKERLSSFPIIESMIEHVADANIAAGYDIKSYEIADIVNQIPRFIEVKAVSLWDYKFYWAKNEIETSEFYRQAYYLYLVPVIGHGDFDMTNLRIIQDPYINVYCNSEWDRSIELSSFIQSKRGA